MTTEPFCSPEILRALCVTSTVPLREVLQTLQRGQKQIALVVDETGHLLGLITDGDVRRAILRGKTLETLAGEGMQTHYTAVREGRRHHEIFEIMKEKGVQHIPVLDEAGVLRDVAWIADLVRKDEMDIPAVVMAGGFGKRLHPLTENTPKPMLPVGDRPLMQMTVERLREAGIRQLNITTHYQPEKIKEHFGDGSAYGVEIDYIAEDVPLGTAGAIGAMPLMEGPCLVINGDILTEVDFRALLNFHREHRADLTVGVRQYDLQVPYGVVECEGERVLQIKEKPLLNFFVNAGIYLLEPAVRGYIPKGQHYDMTDLIRDLIAAGKNVVSFPIVEYWLDIGQHDDYQQAQTDYQSGKVIS